MAGISSIDFRTEKVLLLFLDYPVHIWHIKINKCVPVFVPSRTVSRIYVQNSLVQKEKIRVIFLRVFYVNLNWS